MQLQPSQSPAPRILLVEDESDIRQMLTRVLSRQGYDLVVAADGGEAVALHDDVLAGVDLLISDIVMPGANGAEVARQLRARAPHLGVVFMSGSADHPGLKRVLADGERFIPKPFTIAHFSDVVFAALTADSTSRPPVH